MKRSFQQSINHDGSLQAGNSTEADEPEMERRDCLSGLKQPFLHLVTDTKNVAALLSYVRSFVAGV